MGASPENKKPKLDITASNVIASASGGVASALLLGYFGVAGSVLGAALGPVVFLVAKEMVLRPAQQVAEKVPKTMPRMSSSSASRRPTPVEGVTEKAPSRTRRRLAPDRRKVIIATAALATIITVAFITIPELITGQSMVSDRRTTLFSPAPQTRDDTPTEHPAPSGGTAPEQSPDASPQNPTQTTPTAPAATTPEVPAPAPDAVTPPETPTPEPTPTPSPSDELPAEPVPVPTPAP